jgi:ribosomal protein S18 acetylase RimI-like enzyme
VAAAIREYRAADQEPVVQLSVRAWSPVFAGMETSFGPELTARLHSDWPQQQEREVRELLADTTARVWVAETAASVVGFVAAKVVDPGRLIGEVCMLAVDPDAQRRGVGTTLTLFATEWLRASGMRVAMIGTGGDPGHAPARRVYEKADYRLVPMARYFKPL